jgi:5-methylcytosine-specific restriction endonuclease McrA
MTAARWWTWWRRRTSLALSHAPAVTEQRQTCIKCGLSLPLTRDYFGHRSQTGNFRTTCRTCESARVLAYKRNNRDGDNKRSRERQEKLGGWKPTPQLRQLLFEEQQGRCGLCGLAIQNPEDAQVEHLKPLNQGGSNDEQNLVLAHSKCNQEKHGKSFPEYVAWRERVGLARSTYCSEKILAAMVN